MGGELKSIELCCQLGGSEFVDLDFPPAPRGRIKAWRRPKEMTFHDGRPLRVGEDWQLFRGAPHADDVKQGELGDCWFLSALAALAEFQGGRFVRDLFPDQSSLSPAGAYLVRLCLGGCWRGILVDDRFPCIGGAGYHTQVAYCATYRLQLWASLVEKAFAKACGSYEAVIAGQANEALSVLTGWPTTVINFDRKDFDVNLLWASLESSSEASFLMTCSVGNAGQAAKASGLVPNHAYSLIGVFSVTVPGRGQVRLLKIRNPHAKYTWRGAWSDRSPCWTPEIRKQLQIPVEGNAGVFVMEIADFVKYFELCTICKIRSSKDWCEARIPARIPSGETSCVGMSLEVFEVTECSLSLVQPEERIRQGPLYTDLFEQLACVGFVVLCTDGGSCTVIAKARMRCRSTVSAECWLEPGRSYIVVPLSMHAGSSLDVTCVCVSSRPVLVNERTLDPVGIRAAWVAYARSCPEHERSRFHGATVYTQKADGGAVVAYAENRGNGFFNAGFTFESDGLRYSRGWAVTSDWLSPGQGQLLQVALPDDDSGGNVGWRSSTNFRMSHVPPFPPWHTPDVGNEAHGLHVPFTVSGGVRWDTKLKQAMPGLESCKVS